MCKSWLVARQFENAASVSYKVLKRVHAVADDYLPTFDVSALGLIRRFP
jgi:hypothetical protein